MSAVLNFANIDVSQISFSEPKTNARGGQFYLVELRR